MLDTCLRPAFDKYFISGLAKKCHSRHLRANTVTLWALLCGLSVLPALAANYNGLAITLLLITGYLDCLDGALARCHGQGTALGAVFDIISDRVVELAIILGLVLQAVNERAFLGCLMLGASYLCVSSFLVVGIFHENGGEKSFHYSPGIIERGEAFIFFGLMMSFPACFTVAAFSYTLLVMLTAVIRLWQFQRHCRLQ